MALAEKATVTQTTINTTNPFMIGLLGDNNVTPNLPSQPVTHYVNTTALTYYLQPGDVRGVGGAGGADGINDWLQDGATAAFQAAIASWAAVANITFTQVGTAGAANFVEAIFYDSGSGTLGTHGYPSAGTSNGNYNAGHSQWINSGNNAVGSYSYVTFLHEFGHGIGLEHPHQDGGDDFFPGVSNSGDTGDNGLNQGVWTVMSYNDGWDGDGGNPPPGYGWQATPMAFDIAAIQLIYGAKAANTGNNTYTLPGVNGVGSYYACIWDTGGASDVIRAPIGSMINTIINLNDATLLNQVGGGGFMSRVNGIYGGFTIANGVRIENAVGGGGNDTLTGNEFANLLMGLGGNDTLNGGLGIDILRGELGNDIYVLGNEVTGIDSVTDTGGTDYIWSTITRSLASYSGIEHLILQGGSAINGTGDGGVNSIIGNNAANVLDGGGNTDTLWGLLGNDTYVLGNGSDNVADTGGTADTITSTINRSLLDYLSVEYLTLLGFATNGTGNGSNNLIIGNDGVNVLAGLNGIDTLAGRLGGDAIFGQGGSDRLYGDEGNDGFYYQFASDAGPGSNADLIYDFDDFNNDFISFAAIIPGSLGYRGTLAFNGTDQVRVNDVAGPNVVIEVNLDGNIANAEMQILLINTTAAMIGIDDFIL